MVTKLKEGVYWVGVVDWDARHFHGQELSMRRGTTYNAYLICDEKTVLVDAVAEPFQGQLIANISEIIAPAEIDIGRQELLFVEAPMLHWPDSMFTYLTGDNILMSNDAFGQHYATASRFNDQVNQDELYEEALKYYVNILTPFSGAVARKIDELLALGLPVDVIAPSHGVIWRSDPLQIANKYKEWAAQKPENRAVILYDTMWNATRRMAEAIGQGLAEEGVDCKLIHVGVSDRNDALVEVFKSRTIVLGSPTFNNGLLPGIMPILEDIKGLKFKHKLGAAFGSYGWSGEAVKIIEKHFEDSKIPLAREGIRCKWRPRSEDLAACRAFGKALGEATKSD